MITINKAIDASPELRSKKQLIETFIAGINDVDDVMNEWHSYVVEQRDHDLDNIIADETGRYQKIYGECIPGWRDQDGGNGYR